MGGAASATGSAPRRPTIGRSDGVRVAVASLIAAASSYLVLALAARVLLPVQNNTLFVTFWSTVFACFGVLSGMSIETTRAVTASTTTSPSARPTGPTPRAITVGVGVGLATGGTLAATLPLWAPRLFPDHSSALGALVCVGAAAYAVHSVVVGSLAGSRRWRTYSHLVGAESLMRLCLVLASAAIGTAVVGFATGTALAAFTWVVFLVASPEARQAALTRADSTLPTFLRRLTAASVATGASAVLVVGFPVLLSLTTAPAQYVGAAPVLLAITLTRAPLMIPLNAYQGVAVSHFVEHRDRGVRAMVPAARAVLAVGMLGAALAYLVGPWAMEVLLGAGYRVPGQVLAGLTVAATSLALLTLTGALCQALTLHGAFVAGWVVSVVVATSVLLLPLDLETRAVVALLVGPLLGIALHLTALRRVAVAPLPGRTA